MSKITINIWIKECSPIKSEIILLNREVMLELFLDMMEPWDAVRPVKPYVKKVVYEWACGQSKIPLDIYSRIYEGT